MKYEKHNVFVEEILETIRNLVLMWSETNINFRKDCTVKKLLVILIAVELYLRE